MSAEHKIEELVTDGNPFEHEIGASSSTVVRGTTLLRRLRDRIQVLVKELDRLRDENKALINRINELESAQKVRLSGSSVKFEENKEQLLVRINAFIKTIDDYLLLEEDQFDQ
ncbi:MAG: hypothetical protein OXE59_00290 [Bacteroidetes bacterium]|nr:hypothetical protein [Bacteroidota bacterium]MCY4232173.1 hypothetical protein [Bacteroidota bacterium]